MAKGSQAKIEVGNQIISLFSEDAFWNGEGKELRINTMENGDPIQIKIALTVAKTPVESGELDAIPGEKNLTAIKTDSSAFPVPSAPTEERKIIGKDRR